VPPYEFGALKLKYMIQPHRRDTATVSSWPKQKTKTSRRSIRIGPKVVEALKAHRMALGAVPMPTARVFTAPGGATLRQSNFIRREWQPLLEFAELPPVGFNRLRHTMATDGLRMGLQVKVVQTWLGHAHSSTTLDIYSDALLRRIARTRR
jgi:integrase